jgi:hypothetical protein
MMEGISGLLVLRDGGEEGRGGRELLILNLGTWAGSELKQSLGVTWDKKTDFANVLNKGLEKHGRRGNGNSETHCESQHFEHG